MAEGGVIVRGPYLVITQISEATEEPDAVSVYPLWGLVKRFSGCLVAPGRVLPASSEAESALLGGILNTPSKIEDALDAGLRPDHFFWESLANTYQAMVELHLRDEPIDLITVLRELDRTHGWKNEVDSAETVLRRLLAETNASNVKHWAKIVMDTWAKRQVIREFTDPMKGAWNGVPAIDVIRQVETACIDLRNRIEQDDRATVVSAFTLAEKAEAKMKGLVPQEPGVPTAFSFLPQMRGGRLYLLGGYAKDGKTVVAVQMLRAAIKAKKRVGFVSIEMSHEDLADRIVASYGIPYNIVQRGNVPSMYQAQMQSALSDLARADFHVIDDPGIDVPGIIRHQRLGRYDLLIIDHLHRINYEDARDPRMRLNANVKGLAKLARTDRIPILLLAQLHRPPNSDGFPRPTMQSFKETSTIEQEASALWAVFRKRDPQTGKRLDEAEFLVLADRYGEDIVRPLHFKQAEVRFTEVMQ